jgi:hypothetical protein
MAMIFSKIKELHDITRKEDHENVKIEKPAKNNTELIDKHVEAKVPASRPQKPIEKIIEQSPLPSTIPQTAEFSAFRSAAAGEGFNEDIIASMLDLGTKVKTVIDEKNFDLFWNECVSFLRVQGKDIALNWGGVKDRFVVSIGYAAYKKLFSSDKSLNKSKNEFYGDLFNMKPKNCCRSLKMIKDAGLTYDQDGESSDE